MILYRIPRSFAETSNTRRQSALKFYNTSGHRVLHRQYGNLGPCSTIRLSRRIGTHDQPTRRGADDDSHRQSATIPQAGHFLRWRISSVGRVARRHKIEPRTWLSQYQRLRLAEWMRNIRPVQATASVVDSSLVGQRIRQSAPNRGVKHPH